MNDALRIRLPAVWVCLLAMALHVLSPLAACLAAPSIDAMIAGQICAMPGADGEGPGDGTPAGHRASAQPAEIAHSVGRKVKSYSVDSASELAKLIEMVPVENCEITVRFKLPVGGAAYNFGVQYGELTVEHLGKSANTLPGRIASAAHMADDAGVKYSDFLKENRVEDSSAIREYYAKCRALRRQFLEIMPERVFLEIRHISQYFQ